MALDQDPVTAAPLVSVVMCTYNGRETIEHAVADVLAQTWPRWELVISDDGSTDGTREWLATLQADPRVRIFLQPSNLGYVRNKNFAIQQARGELITQQDQDDRSSPERLQRQFAALERTGLQIAGCGYRRLSHSGETLFEVSCGHETIIEAKGEGDYPFWFPALMVSRRVFDEAGYFDTYFAGAFGDDLYWTVRANERFPIVCIPDLLYSYVDAPASITSLLDNPRKLVMNRILSQLIEQRRATGSDFLEQGEVDQLIAHERRLIGDRRLMAEQCRIYAARAVDQQRWGDAIRLLKRAAELNLAQPQLVRTIAYLARARAKAALRHVRRG